MELPLSAHDGSPRDPDVPGGSRRRVGRTVRALIANEPSIYREVISAALRELRPGVEVFTAEPEDLEEEFVRLLPQFVVCSRLCRGVELGAPVWIELYPSGAPYAIVGGLGTSRKTLPGLDLETLLSILDNA